MPNSQLLRVHRSEDIAGAWIHLRGEMDLQTACVFTGALAETLGTEAMAIHVQLSGLTFCDCAGLGALLGAARATRTAGRTFSACSPTPSVLRLFMLTGTAGILLARRSAPSRQLKRAV